MKKRKSSKLGKTELHRLISLWSGMVPEQEVLKHEKWLNTYHVVRDGNYSLLLESSPGIVERVSRDHLAEAIKLFTSQMPQEFWVTGDEADRVAKSVIYDSKKLTKMPPVLLMKNEPGLAFHRLPFDAKNYDAFNMPIFEEMLSRCSNPDALCCFIGSIFEPKADRQQYLWIYGEGENGKSSLMRFLARLLGPAYHADEVEMSRDKYWTSAFVGRRLVAFPDCNSPCFPRSARFKGLTGSDAIRVEGKYDKAFSTSLDCKFMFLSNEELTISGERADTRRAIYCKLSPIKGKADPRYEEKLFAEAESIIGYCLATYRKLCPNNEQIPVQECEEISELHEDKIRGFILNLFSFEAGGLCRRYEFVEALRQKGVKNDREVSKIKRFIFHKMGVHTERRDFGNNRREMVYVGIKTLDNVIHPNFRTNMGWGDDGVTGRDKI